MKNHLLILLIILLAGCAQNRSRLGIGSDQVAKEELVADAKLESSPRMQSVSNAPQVERKLIKNGQMTIKVAAVDKTRTEISKACKDLNAYVSQEELSNLDDRIQATLTIRVPAENFDTLTKLMEGLADKMDSRSTTVQDVTEEYIDVAARLKTKKDLVTRYREILHEARTVTDILAVEGQINAAQSEVESMEGRLKYLNDQVAFSSLNLTYYQTIGVDFGFGSKFVNAIKVGWDNLLAFVVGLVNIWPFLILIGVGFWGFRRWRKRKNASA